MEREVQSIVMWVVLFCTSALALLTKLGGHYVPASWLSNPRLQRINALIPIALLSALVVAEALTNKTKLVLDHRLAGVAVALVALMAKMPFPVVVLSAVFTSAFLYHWH
ncbi:MAG: AzlD domain-containing protein [Actinomycetota bacterium]